MADEGALDIKALWAQRRRAHERFAQWERAFHESSRLTPAAAFAAAAALYDLLPHAARHRPIATNGVAELHRRLGVVRRTR
jgi:hypothetical protein